MVATTGSAIADVGDRFDDTDRNRDYILGELRKHLQDRAEGYLAEGQKLTVTITDVDLAGEFEPWRGPAAADVRIVKEIYPPRIKLSFRLTDASGAVVKQGERELTNLNFLMTAAPTLVPRGPTIDPSAMPVRAAAAAPAATAPVRAPAAVPTGWQPGQPASGSSGCSAGSCRTRRSPARRPASPAS